MYIYIHAYGEIYFIELMSHTVLQILLIILIVLQAWRYILISYFPTFILRRNFNMNDNVKIISESSLTVYRDK